MPKDKRGRSGNARVKALPNGRAIIAGISAEDARNLLAAATLWLDTVVDDKDSHSYLKRMGFILRQLRQSTEPPMRDESLKERLRSRAQVRQLIRDFAQGREDGSIIAAPRGLVTPAPQAPADK